ncbi:hypothetical protein DL768_011804 [Monosporascus sp. mg162]|nr:hypothetical protein DL768_011804 [Monosporascus sp. mg162]
MWMAAYADTKSGRSSRQRLIHTTASKLFFTIRYEDGIAKGGSRLTYICIKGGGGTIPDPLAVYPFLTRIYQRESDFFTKIAPKPRMKLPKVWWADHGVVVMNDLTYKGYEFTDPLQTWPAERVLVVVEQLAALHAATWGMRSEGYPWITPAYEQLILGLMQTYDAEIRADDGTPSSALSVEDRRAHENDTIDHYLKSLAEFGGPTMERDEEVMAEYAHSFMSSFSWVVAPSSMQTMERVHAMTKRYMAAI